MHRVQPPGRAQRVGKLPPDVRDLGHGEERGHREEGQQGEEGRVEAPARHEPGSGHHHHETAKSGGGLQHHVLQGQALEEGDPELDMAPGEREELAAPLRRVLERDDLAEALDGVHRVGIEVGEGFPGP